MESRSLRLTRTISIFVLFGLAACSSMNHNTLSSKIERGLAGGDDAFHAHKFVKGELFEYEYNDRDIIFCGTFKDGIPIAGEPLFIQEISIPVKIEVLDDGAIQRKLTLHPGTMFRQGPAAQFENIPLRPLSDLLNRLKSEFSYSYTTEHDALSHLQDVFAVTFGSTKEDPKFLQDPYASLFFYKMQDIHQMQDSALSLHDGITPGSFYLEPIAIGDLLCKK